MAVTSTRANRPRKRSDRDHIRQQATKEFNPYANFDLLLGNHNDRQLKAEIDRLETTGYRGLTAAGSLCLEQAYISQELNERLALLERAQKDWQKATALQAKQSFVLDSHVGEALIGLVFLPSHYWLLLQHELPPREVANKSYYQLLGVSQQLVIASNFHHANRATEGKEAKTRNQELAGKISEASTLLLLKRYQIAHHSDQSWHAQPATFTQDRHSQSLGRRHSPWDVSVFTDLGSELDLTYQLQIKYNKNTSFRPPSMSTEVQDIFINPDLLIPTDMRPYHFDHTKIVNECAQEAGGNLFATHNLNRRTDQLLNLMG